VVDVLVKEGCDEVEKAEAAAGECRGSGIVGEGEDLEEELEREAERLRLVAG
jgi:hypothetical protein